MNRSTLMHPRRNASLDAKFPASVTIQSRSTGTKNDYGARSQNWCPVVGLTSLPAQIDQFALRGSSGVEGQFEAPASAPGSEDVQTHDIIFQNYYPAITGKMRAVDDVNGDIYTILLVDKDATSSNSILRVRKVVG